MDDVRLIISRLRKSRKWRQVDLASKSGLSNATISEVESGKTSPTLETIEKIANGFGLTLSELLSYNSPKQATAGSNDVPNPKESETLEKWCNSPDSYPYIKFAYDRLYRRIPPELLNRRIKLYIDI